MRANHPHFAILCQAVATALGVAAVLLAAPAHALPEVGQPFARHQSEDGRAYLVYGAERGNGSQNLGDAVADARRARGKDSVVFLDSDAVLRVYDVLYTPVGSGRPLDTQDLRGGQGEAARLLPTSDGIVLLFVGSDGAVFFPATEHLRPRQVPALLQLLQGAAERPGRRVPGVTDLIGQRFLGSPSRNVLVAELAMALTDARGAARRAGEGLWYSGLVPDVLRLSYEAGALDGSHQMFMTFIQDVDGRGAAVATGPGAYDDYRGWFALALADSSREDSCRHTSRVANQIGEPDVKRWTLERLRRYLAVRDLSREQNWTCFEAVDRAAVEAEGDVYVSRADVDDNLPRYLMGLDDGSPEVPRWGEADTLPFRMAYRLLLDEQGDAVGPLVSAVTDGVYAYILAAKRASLAVAKGAEDAAALRQEAEELRASLAGD